MGIYFLFLLALGKFLPLMHLVIVSKGTGAEGHSLTNTFLPVLSAANLTQAFLCVTGLLKFSGSKQEGFYNRPM